jgi:hypothetical protein
LPSTAREINADRMLTCLLEVPRSAKNAQERECHPGADLHNLRLANQVLEVQTMMGRSAVTTFGCYV